MKKTDVGILQLNEERKQLQNYMLYTNYIINSLDNVFNNYLKIGNYLKKIQEEKLYLIEEYKDIYEYSSKRFNLSKTTTSNIISINNKFTDEDGNLLEEFKGYQFSQLVELISVPNEQLEVYEPKMTIKEIRSIKRLDKFVENLNTDVNSGDISKLINGILKIDYNSIFMEQPEINYEIKNESSYSTDLLRQIIVWFDYTSKKNNYKFYIMVNIDFDDNKFEICFKKDKYFYSYNTMYYKCVLNEFSYNDLIKEVSTKLTVWFEEEPEFFNKTVEEIEVVNEIKKYKSFYWGNFDDILLEYLQMKYKHRNYYYEEIDEKLSIYSKSEMLEDNIPISYFKKCPITNKYEFASLETDEIITSFNTELNEILKKYIDKFSELAEVNDNN